jgi:SAM-dependent methyltransferase
MAEAWFVDEHINILRGPDAEAAVRARSDAQYLVEGEGVTRIPLERWKIAQTFERTGWMEKWRGAGDDRNLDHAAEFNGYRTLFAGMDGKPRHYARAVELGCGPFTNLRVIADVVPTDRVTLLDPLAESYLQLPKCRYTRDTLKTHAGKTVPVDRLLACPIEQMPADVGAFDLVVMMNVIEHCYDVRTIFDKILSITRPGSVFVFHDAMYDPAKTRAVLDKSYYEAGHPLMVGYSVMETFMAEHFRMRYFSSHPDAADQIEVCPHHGRFYFVGERR